MQVTTADCKKFLENLYPNKTDWKRLSKYKENGVWYRDFYQPSIGKVTLKGENSIEFFQLVEPLSFAAEDMDGYGAELIGSPKQTMLELSGQEYLTEISSDTEEDELGRTRQSYSYDSDTTRNYTIFVYDDGSYCYFSC